MYFTLSRALGRRKTLNFTLSGAFGVRKILCFTVSGAFGKRKLCFYSVQGTRGVGLWVFGFWAFGLSDPPNGFWHGLGRPGAAWHGLARPGTAWHGLGRPGTDTRDPPPSLASLARKGFCHTRRTGGRRIYVYMYIISYPLLWIALVGRKLAYLPC